MQQIIDGLLYDTATATLIHKVNLRYGDRWYYQTEKGTFFCWYRKVNIIDIIPGNVMKDILAEQNVPKYIELFGKVDEG